MISKSRLLAILLIIIGGGIIVGFAVLAPNTNSCSLGNSASTVHYTITESSLGYNDSRDHYPSAWPVVTVQLGQLVCIHIQNVDTAEAHGFSIDNYVVSQIVLKPGASKDVVFNANQTGSFTIRCTIPCLVHQYMLDGKLIVTS